MPVVSAKDLIKAGVHFGHKTSNWNPKMKRYIWGKRNKLHIIDIRETIRGFVEATHFLETLTQHGGRVMIVGTKRQAKDAVVTEGKRTGMPYVAERWLGGTLTNLHTVRGQVALLKEYERIEATGEVDALSKKDLSKHNRRKRKLIRNLDGIRTLDTRPNAMIIVDPDREKIAVQEAFNLRIPIIGIIDTDSNPDKIDIPIPANDDAIRSVEFVLNVLAQSIIKGRLAGGLAVPKEALVNAEPKAPAEEAAPTEAEATTEA